jgi:FAD/FMN-containing dehydrogenase
MVPNALLTPTFEEVPGTEIGARFAQLLAGDKTIQMAYGRMDVALDRFFERALLISYRPAAAQGQIPAASGSGFVSKASRYLFRSQVESDRAKKFRWWTESDVGPRIAGNATRNSLMNEPVITLDDRDPFRTDILHEYFVPPARFADFVKACQEVIPASYQQLLNITLRFVDTDADSVLAYAPEPRIAAVMLFSQEKTARGEGDMARMTHALIERVLDIGGAYYLPYRPHASLDQLTRGYPRAAAFAAAKRTVDPGLLFRNALWDGYFARL